jgi:hypothetical protein
MRTEPITYGVLADLLKSLGFQRKVLNAHHVGYYEKQSESLFVLPKCDPVTVARELHVRHVRFQLHWRGVMDEADFDEHLAHTGRS